MTKPLLCIVTDRGRLARVHGVSLASGCELVLRQVEGAVAAGVDLVQIRERDLDARALTELVRNAVDVARGSATRIVVNDRLDIAIAAGAGVHLRETSFTASDARRLAPDIFVGRSIHSAAGATNAGPVDYLIAGTTFRTGAKSEQVEPLGRTGLEEIARAAGRRPVLAIGGIDAATVRGLSETGARGVAAIGAFLPATDAQDVRWAVQQSATALRFAFDSPAGVT